MLIRRAIVLWLVLNDHKFSLVFKIAIKLQALLSRSEVKTLERDNF